MEGDANNRNCEKCSCKVQNISDYSEAQVNELLARVDAGDNICVSFRFPKMNSNETSRLLRAPAVHPAAPKDWPERSVSPAGTISRNRETRELARFSIALAMSIGLTCYHSIGSSPVYGQSS